MKKQIQIAILAAMSFVVCPGAFAGEVKPGDKVAAKWTDGSHYLAIVTGVSGGTLDVLYDDGDRGRIAATGAISIARGADINVGDRVLAAWKSAVMFPGTVTAKTELTVTVKWDDGDEPLEVARDRVVLLRRGAPVAGPAGGFAAGTSVAAKWGAEAYYIATVTGITDSGKYRVEYGDGDKGDVAAGDMVRVDADRGIEVGARVLACWAGARMYPGVVTLRTQDRYMVKWDDGSAPSEVLREKIALLPAR